MDWRSVAKVKPNPNIPEVFPGDTIKVSAQVKEGDRVRTQVFQGFVLKKGGTGPSASITVRRVSSGIGVERTYLLYSPLLEGIEVVHRGSVRRAKLFYLRGRSARRSRIKEKTRPTRETLRAAKEAAVEQVAEEEAFEGEPISAEAQVAAEEAIVFEAAAEANAEEAPAEEPAAEEDAPAAADDTKAKTG